MNTLEWEYDYQNIDYNENQYTAAECMRIGPVDAKYVKSSNPLYVGNPMIEALPRPRDGQILTNAYFQSIPRIDTGELEKLPLVNQRVSVLTIEKLRLPLPFDKQLEFINYDVLANSYSLRKPYIWGDYKFETQIGDIVYEQRAKSKGFAGDSAPSGFSLLGNSGCGKSSALKNLLSNYPQVIMHHPEPYMSLPQITYLVVNCIPNSNFSALYIEIGEAIDNALGNPEPIYSKLIRKCRLLADKQLKVAELIERFSIGTIILDEIQLIEFNKNRENSYEGLLAIVNKTKVALSVVGTDEAYKKLFGKLRNARRSGEFISADSYTFDREEFHKLTLYLFHWQWCTPKVKWSIELSDALYDCSKGLINLLVLLYKWIMLEYLDDKANDKNPFINVEYIKNVSQKHFSHLTSQLDLLELQNKEKEENNRILEAVQNIDSENKYRMDDLTISEAIKNSEITKEIIKRIKIVYPQFDSEIIASTTKRLLSDDNYKNLNVIELTQYVINELLNMPKKKTRKNKKLKANSKDICSYL